MKLLLWLAVLLVVVLWLLHNKKASVKRDKATATARRHAAGTRELVQCEHCGVHVPAPEAVLSSAGSVFCSQEHRLAHAGS